MLSYITLFVSYVPFLHIERPVKQHMPWHYLICQYCNHSYLQWSVF